MKNTVLIIASIYGLLAIVFGAFGAHALKKVLTASRLESFETGVKYQMYHALLLLIMGFSLKLESSPEKWAAYCIVFGTFLFSASIYGLCLQDVGNYQAKFLGPITPLGGLLMIIGWGLLIYNFVKMKY